MKKTIRAILLVSFTFSIAIFGYYFIRRQTENLAASLPVSGRSLDIAADSHVEGEDKIQTRSASRARINPDDDEIFLDAFDINLDSDEDLEQVIVAKPRTEAPAKELQGSAGNRLSVVIADFLPLTGSYRRLWKGGTLAAKPKAFVFQPRDLLGDGKIELLCFGLDESNRQTLTIFRPSNPEGTRYKTIFSESGISIQVVDFQEAGFSRRPALIQAFDAAGPGGSPLDQIRREFVWSTTGEAYRPGSVSFIPGDKVERNYIDKIITGSAVDFETYLEGLWVRETMGTGIPTLLSFQTSRREITISGTPDVQIWNWEESSPAFAGIRSSISNGAVPDMLRLLAIDLVGVDRISVSAHSQQLNRFSPREDWDGTYRRALGTPAVAPGGFTPLLASDALGTLSRPDGSKFAFHAQDLEGSYQGSGFALRLEAGIYQLDERAASRRGRYYFFRYRDSLILDLNPYETATEPSARRTFILHVQGDARESIGGLTLQPAQISSDSVTPSFRPDIELEHIMAQGTR